MVAPAPNYPPPNPSQSQSSSRAPNKPPPPPPLALTDEEDREMRIAALEEQKWVLEQALRVLLNQQQNMTPTTSPSLPVLDKSILPPDR
jgi:hypothetical protein